MPDFLDTVKSLARSYRSLAAAAEAEKPDVAKRHIAHAQALEAVTSELEESRQRLRSVGNALGDLSDLPPEVLAQLNVSKLDELEQQLRDIIASGDEVGLDVSIVELYRRHKVIHPRRFIMNKLYRMAQKGLIFGVDGKKGMYTVNQPKPARNWGGAPFDDLDDEVPF